jgi:catechol 2,3-dioxygenase-like lactoylglutathione lyase family enzyme
MGSGRAIDHVVLAVRSLDRAAAAYERLGFTLTPRAKHEDRMGTSNRLAQFRGRNFIELLEVDRPVTLQPHDLDGDPPFFSFGDHNRQTLKEREGLSMLVFASDDARADLERFRVAGMRAAPFDFERQAVLPDGSEVTVSFSLAFAWSPDMPRVGLFSCQNRAPQFFWKTQYQKHANGADSIATVYLASPEPRRDAGFIGAMFGGEVEPVADGWRVACGTDQELVLLTPEAIARLDASFVPAGGPTLAGIRLSGVSRETTPASAAHGMFIAWSDG